MAKEAVCSVAEVKASRQEKTLSNGDEVLALAYEGKIYVIDALCPHQYAPLYDGEVSKGVIECPFHGWRFDLKTGADPENPFLCLRAWPISIEDGQVWVEVSSK